MTTANNSTYAYCRNATSPYGVHAVHACNSTKIIYERNDGLIQISKSCSNCGGIGKTYKRKGVDLPMFGMASRLEEETCDYCDGIGRVTEYQYPLVVDLSKLKPLPSAPEDYSI